jgi:hypothetical protein
MLQLDHFQRLGIVKLTIGGPGVFGPSLSNDLTTDPRVRNAFVDRAMWMEPTSWVLALKD